MKKPDPQRLTEALAAKFASPTRSTRLTVVLGRWLGISFTICFLTGLFSHGLQNPPSWMFFPTSPVWIYQVTQGLHVTFGIAAIPLLLAKLWSVYPELLKWPPVKSLVHGLERASIALFIASSLLQLTTGLINTYKWYPWPFPFRETHYWLAWVIWGSLLLHIAVKLPAIAAHWRSRPAHGQTAVPTTAGDGGLAAAPTTADGGGLTAAPTTADGGGLTAVGHEPSLGSTAPGRWSRRAFLTGVAAATGTVVVTTAGQSFSWLAPANLFAPRKMGAGPQGVPVNRTAADAKVIDQAKSATWALMVRSGSSSRSFTLAELRALPQHSHDLPIACVEGWSQMATWRGVRVRDLLAAVGAPAGSELRFTSLEPEGAYRIMNMPAEYTRDEKTLVALELNGSELDLDHGYPARIIAPGRPGVLQTKWLQSVEVL